MKSNYSSKPAPSVRAARFAGSGFSHRLARPSVGLTVSSLNANLRLNELWDAGLLDRLSSPLTRRHY